MTQDKKNKLTLKTSGSSYIKKHKGIQVEVRRSYQDRKASNVQQTQNSSDTLEEKKRLLEQRKKELQESFLTSLNVNKNIIEEQTVEHEHYQNQKLQREQAVNEKTKTKEDQAKLEKVKTEEDQTKNSSDAKTHPVNVQPANKASLNETAYKKPSKLTHKNQIDKKFRKVSVYQILENAEREFDVNRGASLAALKRRREKVKQQSTASKIQRTARVSDSVSIESLATQLSERVSKVLNVAKNFGINDVDRQTQLDVDSAELITEELGHKFVHIQTKDIFDVSSLISESDPKNLVPRSPIVAVMGHVDHGKTSLLDAIRSTKVTDKEAGGITQHIGAYQVHVQEKDITFLDTPGHAAFTAMRMRGAEITDIALLLVAADDGIQPQTLEALAHIQTANVPFIVVVTKIDRPDSNEDKVLESLLSHNVIVEKFGGEVQSVAVSSITGKNIDKLLDSILIQAEMLDLKSDPTTTGVGVVIESRKDKNQGILTTVLVKNGTLTLGSAFLSGLTFGKIKRQHDFLGNPMKNALPSTPVEIMGYRQLPKAGDDFIVFSNESKAESIANQRAIKAKTLEETNPDPMDIKDLFEMQNSKQEQLLFVIKTDVVGSLEALESSLLVLNKKTDEVLIKIVYQGVGPITESDIDLAKTTNAHIISFHLHVAPKINRYAQSLGIKIFSSDIIYEILEQVEQDMAGLLAPIIEEHYLGQSIVQEIFKIKGVGNIAGCSVQDGVIKYHTKAKLIRDSKEVFRGNIKQLRHFKDTVNEVRSGQECGISFENFNDIHIGDTIECFEIQEKPRSL